jgi:hypothetical protein
MADNGFSGKSTEYHQFFRERATRIFDIGLAAAVGEAIGQGTNWSLEAYLANVAAKARFCPECAAEAAASGFEEIYILCDPRAGLSAACRCGNIRFDGDENGFVPFDDRHAVPRDPYWVTLNPGRRNRANPPAACREEFAQEEGILSARAMDGVFGYIHVPGVVTELADNRNGYAMNLPGSVVKNVDHFGALLRVLSGPPAELDLHMSSRPHPQYGSAFLRECGHVPR